MSSLADIPSCTALHIPVPGTSPLPLSTGDLVLSLIPANPPSHPSTTLAISIGASSFPLLPSTPLQKVSAKSEHASYIFSPAPADGGASIGQVKIVMKDSKSQGEWEATEALCAKFEQTLQEHGLWESKTLFVDDEYETASGTGAKGKGWGETVAGAVMGAGQALVEKINAYTDNHVSTTNPTHPPPPSDLTAQRAKSAESTTNTISQYAATGAEKLGAAIHDGAKYVGDHLPDSIAKKSEPVPEHEKSDIRKMAEGTLGQFVTAAKGVANAAVSVGGAVSTNAHKAVEHNYGKNADGVAQDIGQTGANVGSTAMSGMEATSIIMQGRNAAMGISEAKQ